MSRAPDQADAYIGVRIAGRRTALGLSQARLAEGLRLSVQQVQKYEAGVNRVPASRLNRIAQLLAAPITHFLPGLSATDAEGVSDADDRSLTGSMSRIADPDVRRALAVIARALATA